MAKPRKMQERSSGVFHPKPLHPPRARLAQCLDPLQVFQSSEEKLYLSFKMLRLSTQTLHQWSDHQRLLYIFCSPSSREMSLAFGGFIALICSPARTSPTGD